MAHTKWKWTYCEQNGLPGHCFQAQVWDKHGDSLAIIEPTYDPKEAINVARLMAAAPDLLEVGEQILEKLKHPTQSVSALDAEELEQAIKKAKGE